MCEHVFAHDLVFARIGPVWQKKFVCRIEGGKREQLEDVLRCVPQLIVSNRSCTGSLVQFQMHGFISATVQHVDDVRLFILLRYCELVTLAVRDCADHGIHDVTHPYLGLLALESADCRHTIRIELGPDLPLVMADSRPIVQVLSNLLSNAARHSPKSSPKPSPKPSDTEASVIRLSVLRKNGQVEISVTDDGRGIPADRMAVLFRKFSQVEPEDNGGDTGLGLAVCKGIVEAHGGRIWAESEGPGLGSRFTFTLPAVEGSASVGPKATHSQPTHNPTTHSQPTPNRTPSTAGQDEVRPRIPVVDNDPQTLRCVRDVLSKAGYWPIVTADPEEVPRLMEDEKLRLVLLDLMLPGTDGIIVMKSIHDVADVPIIFLSAYGQDQVIARAFEMGAADYVVKPFSPTELVARIHAAPRSPPAALRRPSHDSRQPGREPYEFGEMVIDFERRTTTLGGLMLKLTPTEYRVLAELAANASRVLTHEQLLRRIWPNNRTGKNRTGDSGPVRTIIKRLRRKLGDDAASPTYIHTEPRVGYFMPATLFRPQFFFRYGFRAVETSTLKTGPGAVPNGEIVGLRIAEGGSASNDGKTYRRHSLGGNWFEISAVDASNNSVSSYGLSDAVEACVPLPDELRSNISGLALVAINSDDSLTILASSVRISASGTNVCGSLSSVPAKLTVGTAGSPAALPTAVLETADTSDLPDTGGAAPSSPMVVFWILIVGLASLVVGGAMRRARRNSIK